MKKGCCIGMSCALLVFASKAYADTAWLTAVPEIDAGSAATALGVLSGLIALAAERLRRK
jgi:hypothetical protein